MGVLVSVSVRSFRHFFLALIRSVGESSRAESLRVVFGGCGPEAGGRKTVKSPADNLGDCCKMRDANVVYWIPIGQRRVSRILFLLFLSPCGQCVCCTRQTGWSRVCHVRDQDRE